MSRRLPVFTYQTSNAGLELFKLGDPKLPLLVLMSSPPLIVLPFPTRDLSLIKCHRLLSSLVFPSDTPCLANSEEEHKHIHAL